MRTTFEYCNEEQAIKILQKLKKNKGNKKQRIIICTIDFDNDTQIRKTASPDEGCILIRNSEMILLNKDDYVPHMELYSIIQDMNNIRSKGVMHDIIWGSG